MNYITCNLRGSSTFGCSLRVDTSSHSLCVASVFASCAMVSMKAVKKGFAAAKGSTKKRPAGVGVADDLWKSDPCLAASLALVPLHGSERSRAMTMSQPAPSKDDSKSIVRKLPPALQSFKTTGEWQKTCSTAV